MSRLRLNNTYRHKQTIALILILFGIGITTFAANKFEKLQNFTLKQYDTPTLSRVQLWIALIESARSLTDNEKLHAANDFFNTQIFFSDDIQIWKQEDYWATPLETINKQQGDCEDFSLAKYVTLLVLGIPEDRIRLIYVQATLPSTPTPIAHMVVAYYPTPNAEPLVLDNLVPQIQLASKRPDLSPVFSFNASSLWVSGQQSRYGDSQSRLSKWQDVLSRIKKEGYFDE